MVSLNTTPIKTVNQGGLFDNYNARLCGIFNDLLFKFQRKDYTGTFTISTISGFTSKFMFATSGDVSSNFEVGDKIFCYNSVTKINDEFEVLAVEYSGSTTKVAFGLDYNVNAIGSGYCNLKTQRLDYAIRIKLYVGVSGTGILNEFVQTSDLFVNTIGEAFYYPTEELKEYFDSLTDNDFSTDTLRDDNNICIFEQEI